MRADLEARIREAFGDDADTAIEMLNLTARITGRDVNALARNVLARGQNNIDQFLERMREIEAMRPTGGVAS